MLEYTERRYREAYDRQLITIGELSTKLHSARQDSRHGQAAASMLMEHRDRLIAQKETLEEYILGTYDSPEPANEGAYWALAAILLFVVVCILILIIIVPSGV